MPGTKMDTPITLPRFSKSKRDKYEIKADGYLFPAFSYLRCLGSQLESLKGSNQIIGEH
jgi:hypothetical protein